MQNGMIDGEFRVGIHVAAAAFWLLRPIIAAERGRQFDPEVTDAFLRDFDKFVSIAEKHRDLG